MFGIKVKFEDTSLWVLDGTKSTLSEAKPLLFDTYEEAFNACEGWGASAQVTKFNDNDNIWS